MNTEVDEANEAIPLAFGGEEEATGVVLVVPELTERQDSNSPSLKNLADNAVTSKSSDADALASGTNVKGRVAGENLKNEGVKRLNAEPASSAGVNVEDASFKNGHDSLNPMQDDSVENASGRISRRDRLAARETLEAARAAGVPMDSTEAVASAKLAESSKSLVADPAGFGGAPQGKMKPATPSTTPGAVSVAGQSVSARASQENGTNTGVGGAPQGKMRQTTTPTLPGAVCVVETATPGASTGVGGAPQGKMRRTTISSMPGAVSVEGPNKGAPSDPSAGTGVGGAPQGKMRRTTSPPTKPGAVSAVEPITTSTAAESGTSTGVGGAPQGKMRRTTVPALPGAVNVVEAVAPVASSGIGGAPPGKMRRTSATSIPGAVSIEGSSLGTSEPGASTGVGGAPQGKMRRTSTPSMPGATSAKAPSTSEAGVGGAPQGKMRPTSTPSAPGAVSVDGSSTSEPGTSTGVGGAPQGKMRRTTPPSMPGVTSVVVASSNAEAGVGGAPQGKMRPTSTLNAPGAVSMEASSTTGPGAPQGKMLTTTSPSLPGAAGATSTAAAGVGGAPQGKMRQTSTASSVPGAVGMATSSTPKPGASTGVGGAPQGKLRQSTTPSGPGFQSAHQNSVAGSEASKLMNSPFLPSQGQTNGLPVAHEDGDEITISRIHYMALQTELQRYRELVNSMAQERPDIRESLAAKGQDMKKVPQVFDNKKTDEAGAHSTSNQVGKQEGKLRSVFGGVGEADRQELQAHLSTATLEGKPPINKNDAASPDAAAVGGTAAGHASGAAMDGRQVSQPNPSAYLPSAIDNDLVTARPVALEDDHDEEMPQASEYDLEAAKERKQTASKTAWRKFGGLLVLVAAVILIIIFATGSHKNDELSPSPTISASPSMTPSAAPSTQEEKLLSLLPAATVDAIEKALTTEKETPQSMAFWWLMDDPNVAAYSDMRLVQRFALATFHFSTGGPTEWWRYISESWLNHSLHECEWGFTHSKFLGDLNDTRIESGEAANDELWFEPPEAPCEMYEMAANTTGSEDHEKYTSLWVPGANLVGEIPPETFLLTSLRFINIQQNFEVEGAVPTQIGLLSSLEGLNLGARMELGPLPSEIGGCTSLKALRTHNATGTFPTEFGQLQELEFFQAEGAMMTGSLPSEIGLMRKLEVLYLEDNGFTGNIPQEFTHMTSLVTVQMQWNSLTGTIPTEIAYLTNLLMFDVYANHLTGRIPSEIGTMTQLTDLWLHINQITGSIPTELGNLDMFIFPVLKTQLSGPIPSELGRWTGCYKFVLQDNQLSGPIPSELGLMTGLNSFKVFKNRLTGPIPSELGQFKELDILGLHTNGITGTIPTELGMLTTATEILLNSMELTGKIPTQLGLLSSVSLLHLNDNNLFGPVPLELGGNFSNLESLHLQINGLTGTVPDEVCRHEESAELLFDCYEQLCGCSSCACSASTTDAMSSNVTIIP